MYIPDDLIKGLATADGPVLIYFRDGSPRFGFVLRNDEYVTSQKAEDEARKKAGLDPVDYRRNKL